MIKYSEVMATERERIEKLKEKLSTKSYFLSSSLMKPVYQNKKGSSNDRNNDRVCSGSKEMVERVTMEKEGRVSIGSKGKEKKNKYNKDAEKKRKEALGRRNPSHLNQSLKSRNISKFIQKLNITYELSVLY